MDYEIHIMRQLEPDTFPTPVVSVTPDRKQTKEHRQLWDEFRRRFNESTERQTVLNNSIKS